MTKKSAFLCQSLVLAMFCLVFSSLELISKETEITNFYLDSIVRVYKSKAIEMHCERFDITSNLLIKKIRFGLLSNKKNTSCILKIYKYEGQQSVPRTENEIINQIKIEKASTGYEEKVVELSVPVNANFEQVFVCFESFSDGLYLLTDDTYKEPYCRNCKDVFTNQLQKDKTGKWSFSNFSYQVSLIGEEIESDKKDLIFEDQTAEYFDEKDIDSINACINKNLLIFDINEDSYNDIIVDNIAFSYDTKTRKYTRSYLNEYLNEKSILNYYLNYNGDDKLDLLSVSLTHDENDTTQYALFQITENIKDKQHLRTKEFKFKDIRYISSIAVNDLNYDGNDDIIVTQNNDSLSPHNYYIISSGGNLTLNELSSNNNYSVNGISSHIVTENSNKSILIFKSDGSYETWNINFDNNQKNSKSKSIISKRNNDSLNINLTYDVAKVSLSNQDSTNLINNTSYKKVYKKEKYGLLSLKYDKELSEFEDNITTNNSWIISNSGVVSGDLNNDKNDDLIFFTDDKCYSSNLLMYNQSKYDKETYVSGFAGQSLGRDGIVSDMDNDGKQDLITFSNNKFVMFRNNISISNNSIKLTDKKQTMLKDGAKVVLYIGNEKLEKEVKINYSWFMQSPAEIHYGIKEASKVDSVYVESNNEAKMYYDLVVNKTNDLSDLVSKKYEPYAEFEAYPNPFSTDVSVEIKNNLVGNIEIQIVDVSGNLIKSIYKGKVSSGSLTVNWDSKDANNQMAKTGAYLITLSYKDKLFTKKIIKVN